MKLSRITRPLRSVQVRVMLAGEVNAALENYARFYEHIHGDPVEPRVLIPEMLRAFIDADREFQAWSRCRSNGSQHPAASPALPQTKAKTQLDCVGAAVADALGAAPRA
jgi:hypothetical protein